MRKKIKRELQYLFIVLMLGLLQRSPRKCALLLGALLGRLAFRLIRRERENVRRGLRVAFGGKKDGREIDGLAQEVFVELGKNVSDVAKLRAMSKGDLWRIVRPEGFEHLDRALAKGRGVIVIAGHLGNWELLAAYLASRGYPLNVVGRRLHDPRLDQALVRLRERWGVRNIARGRDTRDVLRALRRGEMVGLLIDQDTKVSGVFVDFFGRAAYTPVGPAVLATKLGAPVISTVIHRARDGTHRVQVGAEIDLSLTGNVDQDLRTNTERCSKVLERHIRQHPAQWVWMHDRWKTKPS